MEYSKYNKSFFDAINERFSCRDFLDKKLTKEEILSILEAGRLAPTAVNYQPVKIYVIENEELLEKMKEATRFTFGAKTIFVICYDPNISWHRHNDGKDHGDIDATIVATHMMLAATAMDLGTCYVCSYKEELLKQIIGIPAEYKVSCMLPIGYKAIEASHNSRKELEDIVVWK